MRTVRFPSNCPAPHPRRHALSSLRFAVLVGALLVFAGKAVRAQLPMAPHAAANTGAANAPAAPAAAAAQKPAAQAREEGGGTHEGIKVHGHWVIEVRSPDGSLVRHAEFENSLFSGQMLYAFLGGTETPGAWTVQLEDGAEQYVLYLDEPSATAQIASDAGFCTNSPSTEACARSLAVAATASGGLTLSGSITIPGTFPVTVTLASAVTSLGYCPGDTYGAQLSGALSTVSPSSCLPVSTDLNISNTFTERLQGFAVPVSPGQTVSATVTITFS